MKRLDGRTCVVTGAAKGIGLAIASALLREGANVVYADIDPAVTEVAAAAAAALGAAKQGRGCVVDVADRSSTADLIATTTEWFGALDVYFNNAGINTPIDFLDVTEELWNRILRVNALSVLLGTQEAARCMIAQGRGGKVINTASISGRQGYSDISPYCASKFAVVALTQSAARALAPHKITVNAFAPGVVRTPMWQQVDRDLMRLGVSSAPGEAMDKVSSSILLGRPAEPDDIVGTTSFLASSDSDYITGQVIMVDGGMVLV